MFVCANCMKEFPDDEMAYTLLYENRMRHPAKYFFERRFHSLECLEAELDRLVVSYGPFVLFKATGAEGREQLTPKGMPAGELLAWVKAGLPAIQTKA